MQSVNQYSLRSYLFTLAPGLNHSTDKGTRIWRLDVALAQRRISEALEIKFGTTTVRLPFVSMAVSTPASHVANHHSNNSDLRAETHIGPKHHLTAVSR